MIKTAEIQLVGGPKDGASIVVQVPPPRMLLFRCGAHGANSIPESRVHTYELARDMSRYVHVTR